MNRRKKIKQKLTQKLKKANAKLQPGRKPKYIAKADRQVAESSNPQENM